MHIENIEAKSILTRSNLPESDYVINPYVGCSHGCYYCYARFMRRFTGHSNDRWGNFVDIKTNAHTLIEKKMKRFKNTSSTILLGSVTDAYQPIEKKTHLTRKILRHLLEKDCKVSILTKSDLVLRDIDLLAEFSCCSVGLSVSFLDDHARQVLEPKACSIDRRINALKKLHESGIHTYAFIGPIFPHLTPLPELLRVLYEHVDEVWAEALNLKCGCLSELSMALERGFPDISKDIIELARDTDYWIGMEEILTNSCKQFKVPLVGFYRH